MLNQIPGPRGLPFLGNLLNMDMEMPLRGLERLAEQYGPIYQITLKGQRQIICSSAELMAELTDEKRFVKLPPQAISATSGPKGLFSAKNDDPDWAQGHRILMPSFAPLAVQDMFDDMKDIANQLVLSWARKGPDHVILATEDFTRLTLDTIALCTMDYRFNSFYQDKMHPFIDAMLAVLSENSSRTGRPAFLTKAMIRKDRQHEENRRLLRQTGMDIIQNRKANPKDDKDVLNTMIYGKDPKTGQSMRDELIAEQMTTFLIAGHETTSGLLSFAFVNLLKNPETYFKAQEEVDRVIGNRAIEFSDIKNLHYLNGVLRETMRLCPTVPALAKGIHPDRTHDVVTLDGYVVEPTDRFMVLLTKSQKDPKVWGEDAEEFKPERMTDENFERISSQHPGSWKPFGNGKRACIGRPFAWQEALLVLAVVLQSFDVKLDDPAYEMKIKQALTIKPDNFKIRVQSRHGHSATAIDHALHSGHTNGSASASKEEPAAGENGTNKRSMTILYGSNTGTCQALAQRAAADAASRGFSAEILDMDSAVESLSNKGPIVIFTSSYEGEPPDNAVKFMEWLQKCQPSSLSQVEFAVFGCGHRDWTQTFHRIPKLADELLEKAGARRIATPGFTDAAKGNVFGDFEEWLDATLWPALRPSTDSEEEQPAGVDFELSTDARATALRFDVHPATVVSNFKLTAGKEPEKFHLEIALPSDSDYECGDYLAVLPQNSEKAVREVMALFNLPWDAVITIKGDGPSAIPLNTPTPVSEILRSYVELSQPITKKTLRLVTTYTSSESIRTNLLNLASNDNDFTTEVTNKRLSLLHILHQHRNDISLPVGLFLSLLPPLQVRQYSISSSPLANPGHCTLTYGVLDTASLSDASLRFQGVTSNYLRSLTAGDQIQVAVRPAAKKTFRLPLDLEGTPMLMFAAGTGIAPFRGFCQQRALQLAAGRKLADALLFVGCRSATDDRVYAEEIDRWVEAGVVDVRYAFSKETDKSEGCRYVNERMVRDSEHVRQLWRAGAKVYLCGSRRFADSVRAAGEEIAQGAVRDGLVSGNGNGNGNGGVTVEEMQERFKKALQERVASDVFD